MSLFSENTNISSRRPTYIIGDPHGMFGALLHLIEKEDIKDCYLISVGDLGIGFRYGLKGELEGIRELTREFMARDIIFMSIRGNHDNPQFWNIGEDGFKIDYSHFKLIPDYTTMDINGEKFLFVGGAISIDRKRRRPGYSYWENEVFVLDESKIVECDVLVTHSGPNWIGPYDKSGIEGWCKNDPELWDDCKKERADHNRLYELAKPKKAYLGHFHMWQGMENNGCYATILNELQITEHRKQDHGEG